jgi:hypothetical protein
METLPLGAVDYPWGQRYNVMFRFEGTVSSFEKMLTDYGSLRQMVGIYSLGCSVKGQDASLSSRSVKAVLVFSMFNIN